MRIMSGGDIFKVFDCISAKGLLCFESLTLIVTIYEFLYKIKNQTSC